MDTKKLKHSLMLMAALALFLFAQGASPWSHQDTLWESAYLTAHFIDWGQTRYLANKCDSGEIYRERNRLLGDCPSRDTVNTYFIGTGLLHIGIARMLTGKYRRLFQAGTFGLQLGVINNNTKVGLKIHF